MRNLVSVADVRKWREKDEKTVYIDAGTIITPAARDAAREGGIEIIEGDAPGLKPSVACRTDSPRLQNIDQALIARIVEEVIAALSQPKVLACETDPSGFKLARGERLNWSGDSDKYRVKQIFDGRDNLNCIAGLISLEGTAPEREMKRSEIHHVLSGTVSYRINGREYIGKTGDTAFLPMGTQVGLATADRGEIFFVACGSEWWKNSLC